MHYANENQLSALKQLGFTPTEDKTTLTEVAQWLWEKHNLQCDYTLLTETLVKGFYTISGNVKPYHAPTIPEALSWAIDQAIKYLQENAKQ